jgi:hypothetical protein
MGATEVVDVACAINTFLPSAKDLGKYLIKGKAAKKAMFKGLKKGKNLKEMRFNAVKANKKAF